MISAVILTKNKESILIKSLDSVLWCDEVILVDDYSEEKKIIGIKKWIKQKCQPGKISIFQRHLNEDFASQRNFGLEKAKGDWVLFVDSDEVVSKKLAYEIKSQISPDSLREAGQANLPAMLAGKKSQNYNVKFNTEGIRGFYIRRKDYFLGKWLKHGETGNLRLLRLAQKNAGRWQGKVHETWMLKGKTEELNNPLLHYPHQSVADFLRQINWYTDIVAQSWKEEGRKVYFWEIILFPLGKFLKNFFFRLGFLDGVPGLILALMMSFHSFLARSKLWTAINK